MKKALTLLVVAAVLGGCTIYEGISRYADRSKIYQLVTLNGEGFPARATIAFPDEGRVSGQAPCNRYSAMQTVPYPWFALEALAVTRMACPDLELETAFLSALQQMTLAEVAGDILILSNPSGRALVFEAQ